MPIHVHNDTILNLILVRVSSNYRTIEIQTLCRINTRLSIVITDKLQSRQSMSKDEQCDDIDAMCDCNVLIVMLHTHITIT